MALSNLEKIRILRLLGWPAKTLDSESLSYSNIISGRLTNLDDDILSETRTILGRLERLETRSESALNRAGVKSVDDIELFGNEFDVLRREKMKLVRELSTILDIFIVGIGGVPSQGNVVV